MTTDILQDKQSWWLKIYDNTWPGQPNDRINHWCLLCLAKRSFHFRLKRGTQGCMCVHIRMKFRPWCILIWVSWCCHWYEGRTCLWWGPFVQRPNWLSQQLSIKGNMHACMSQGRGFQRGGKDSGNHRLHVPGNRQPTSIRVVRWTHLTLLTSLCMLDFWLLSYNILDRFFDWRARARAQSFLWSESCKLIKTPLTDWPSVIINIIHGCIETYMYSQLADAEW